MCNTPFPLKLETHVWERICCWLSLCLLNTSKRTSSNEISAHVVAPISKLYCQPNWSIITRFVQFWVNLKPTHQKKRTKVMHATINICKVHSNVCAIVQLCCWLRKNSTLGFCFATRENKSRILFSTGSHRDICPTASSTFVGFQPCVFLVFACGIM